LVFGWILLGGGPDQAPRLALHGIGGLFQVAANHGKLLAEARESAIKIFRGDSEIAEGDVDVFVAREVGGKSLGVLKSFRERSFRRSEKGEVLEGLGYLSILG
jgi:hypothetical protein